MPRSVHSKNTEMSVRDGQCDVLCKLVVVVFPLRKEIHKLSIRESHYLRKILIISQFCQFIIAGQAADLLDKSCMVNPPVRRGDWWTVSSLIIETRMTRVRWHQAESTGRHPAPCVSPYPLSPSPEGLCSLISMVNVPVET